MPASSRLQILVWYNEPVLEPQHPEAESEHEVVDTARRVAGALAGAGYGASRLGINADPAPLLQVLRTDRPHAVFNLFEGTGRQSESEAYVAGLLEWLRVPFTGCPSSALLLARDKPKAKILLRGAGLPTPQGVVVDRLPAPDISLGWPVIVKPAAEDASVGLDQGSVVTNPQQLQERIALLRRRFAAPVLVESFLP